MGSLFIIGNGFDLAHGIQTRYSDFKKFLINKYPTIQKNRDTTFGLEKYMDIRSDELSAELLLYAMDYAAGDEWNDFEAALSNVNFYHKLPRLTTDIHKTDEYVKNYLMYMDILSTIVIRCSDLWQDLFVDWIKNIEINIEKGNFKPKHELELLFSDKTIKYITFNYTKTLQKLYNISVVKHIHNRVGQKLIFGHGENNCVYEEPNSSYMISSSDLDNMLGDFKKDTTLQLKKYNKFFKNLNQTIDKVYSYGFSYSKVDSVYIKLIISKISPNATWFFTDYEAADTNAIRIKKIKLRKYGFKGEFSTYSG